VTAAVSIAKRELKSYFVSPVAYVILGIFALVSSIHFLMSLETFDQILNQAQMQAQFMQNASLLERINLNEMLISQVVAFAFFLLLFASPALTMRSIAEERNQGTYELLFTSPISLWDIALGKWLAAIGFYMLLLLTHGLLVGVVFAFGNPEVAPVFSGYLGLLLYGSLMLSLGIFASSLTTNQIVAFFIALFLGLTLLMIGWAARMMPGNLATFFEAASVQTHFENFNKGLITVSSLVYFVTATVFFLAASQVSLQSLTRK
jgi:ABC-2 type transport system permease protein